MVVAKREREAEEAGKRPVRKVGEDGMALLIKRRGMEIARRLHSEEGAALSRDEMRALSDEVSVLLQSSEAGRLTHVQVDFPPLPREGREGLPRITTLYSELLDCGAYLSEKLAGARA